MPSVGVGDQDPVAVGYRDNRILTGHGLFDHIVQLYPGMSVLVIDETFTEGRNLIKTLFRDPGDLTELLSSHHIGSSANQIAISLESLQDVSIEVNQLRRTLKSRVLIHSYLPELLIRRGTDEVLRLLELWRKDVTSAGHLEFYLLPRGTFEDLERKLKVIMDGVIEISVVKKENIFTYFMTPIRICEPQYHLKIFQYKLTGGKLLIEWEGQFVDRPPTLHITHEELVNIIVNEGSGLIILKNEADIENLMLEDYLLLTSLNGRRVSYVKQLFPDRWDEIVEKLAYWAISGLIKLERVEPEPEPVVRTRLKRKNRLLLSLPLFLTMRLIKLSKGFLGSRVRTVPLDAHIAVLTAMKNIVDFAFGDRPDLRREVQWSTKFFGELSARETALQYVKLLEGTPFTNFDPKYVSRIIALTLKTGWDLNIAFKESNKNSYIFEVIDCHLCKGVKSDSPFCDKFVSSVVLGSVAICYHRKAECYEFMCRAMGADKCAFQVTVK
ncbi:MAG: hypothetical protein QXX57_01820 [Nitrososphaerota archaeon]